MKKLLLTSICIILFPAVSNKLFAQIMFQRHNIANISNANTTIRCHPADLNNDGAVDIVTAEAIGGHRVHWWKSSGGINPTFTKIQIDNNFPQSGPLFTADVNGDGHLDILGTSFTGDKVVYWQNDGNNPTPTFTRIVLKSGYASPLKAIAADLDNDGDIDVAVVARVPQQLRLFINDGNLNPSFTQVVIANSLSNVDGLAYGDVNMDGRMDLVVAHPGNAKVTLFKGSPTAPNGFTSEVIAFPFYCKNIFTADMNGDGFKDVLNLYQVGNLDKIGYLKSTGGTTPTFTNTNVGTYDNSFSIFPIDLDNDGDMDVLGGSNWEDGFRWWENQGGTTPSFQSHLIEKNFVMAWTAKPADMDGDGDMDFVASTGWKLHWFENDLIEPCEISITCKDPFNFPITQNGGTSVISGSDMVKDHLTEDCGSNLDYTINGQQLLDFNCSDIGPQTLSIIATDESGNTASCTIPITVVDLIAPSITCPENQTDFLNDVCQFEIPDYTGLATASDNCSYEITQSPIPGSLAGSGNHTITLTATDPGGNTTPCSFDLTLSDNTVPHLQCPPSPWPNLPFPTDPGECGATLTIPLPQLNDNCGVVTVTARVREINEFDEPIGPWFEVLDDPSGFFPVGYWRVLWRGDDAAGKWDECKYIFSVGDNEAPTPVCLNTTVTFNGEASFDLNLSDLYDADASSDNCTPVQVQGFSPMAISCDQVGSIVPVSVNVTDENGNATSCTANVTVEGLPCGWSQNPDGVGCPGGSDATFNPTNGSFTVSSDGCYNPNYYSNYDVQSFASAELCGDGEIIAHVTQLTGSGWAGISMREDLSPGSKMLQLSIDGAYLTKREMRTSTNGIAFNHLFQTQGKTWLKLTRSGSTFGAYHSSDGVSWAPVIITNISMNSCIQVGLFTKNNTPSGTTTATFEEVEIKPSIQPLSAPNTSDMIQAEPQELAPIDLYPNPAASMITIDFNQEMDQTTLLRLRNTMGQLIEERRLEPFSRKTQWNIEQLVNGIYFIEIHKEGQKVAVERFIKN